MMDTAYGARGIPHDVQPYERAHLPFPGRHETCRVEEEVMVGTHDGGSPNLQTEPGADVPKEGHRGIQRTEPEVQVRRILHAALLDGEEVTDGDIAFALDQGPVTRGFGQILTGVNDELHEDPLRRLRRRLWQSCNRASSGDLRTLRSPAPGGDHVPAPWLRSAAAA